MYGLILTIVCFVSIFICFGVFFYLAKRAFK